jgi:hypothetical protein
VLSLPWKEAHMRTLLETLSTSNNYQLNTTRIKKGKRISIGLPAIESVAATKVSLSKHKPLISSSKLMYLYAFFGVNFCNKNVNKAEIKDIVRTK